MYKEFEFVDIVAFLKFSKSMEFHILNVGQISSVSSADNIAVSNNFLDLAMERLVTIRALGTHKGTIRGVFCWVAWVLGNEKGWSTID